MSQRDPAAEGAQRIADEQAFSPERYLAKADRWNMSTTSAAI
jgi:hypothetical protein